MNTRTPATDLSITPVDDLNLPTLEVYRHLKDRRLKCRQGLFIAEGQEVVRRLLRSGFEVHSLLVTREKLERLRPDIPPGVPVYTASVRQMQEIAGFAIHRGAVACGQRRENLSLEAAISAAADGRMVMVMENICDAQNVGLLIRNAAAFRVGLVVTSCCCDPFYRRAVRVSMGNVFRMPIYDTDHLIDDLLILRDRLSLTLVAAELSAQAVPLHEVPIPPRVALLFGAEGGGLSPAVLEVCDHRVVIPMDPESDSVNVAVAAGIFLHTFASPPRCDGGW
ncbi:MAG: RNA methyltransferase [Phycisphaerae bacterium]|nr:RNA methyltransferase [Phycisphaerae bacterium]